MSKQRNGDFWDCMLKLETGCWEWQGSRDQAGYGSVRVNGVTRRAHRIAYQLTYGNIPNVLRHTCDNPPCCNPNHLIDGTHADNVADRIAKGRSRHVGLRGERGSGAKLLTEDVLQIRDLYANHGWTQVRLARYFEIHQTEISLIVNRKHWKDV